MGSLLHFNCSHLFKYSELHSNIVAIIEKHQYQISSVFAEIESRLSNYVRFINLNVQS